MKIKYSKQPSDAHDSSGTHSFGGSTEKHGDSCSEEEIPGAVRALHSLSGTISLQVEG